ncbi:hypothetical protein L1049_013972 [Liquidambar formosana]|uniref:Cyclin-dependent protein kinase inhibitor SMR3-like n=1 Tax=Liquidambar formosana TaxID=63359 RepID=A0AAP0WUI8_LIQFO
MFSEFNSFSFMGMSNSDHLLLSEKDLELELESMEFKFLVRPAFEFPDGCPFVEDGDLHQKEEVQEEVREEEKTENCEKLVSSLKLKIPSLAEFKVEHDHDDEDGCRTPTSLDQRIPLILPCPPPPRKPKSLPSTKRKVAPASRKILLDLSNEVESLFPPALLADLGGKMKKVRKGNCTL